jgi:hypothetical protein
MDKKPFDRRQGQGTQAPGQPTKPESGRKMPEAMEKEKTPRLGEQPAGPLVDKRMPMPGAGRKDILEGERSDHESGRPVQLEEDDDSTGNRRDADVGGRRQHDRKPAEGQTAKR